MIYLNEQIPPLKRFFANLVFPNSYYALSINDFIENAKDVKPSWTTFSPVGLIFYGQALIGFPNPVTHHKRTDKTGVLTDITGSIEVATSFMNKKSIAALTDGKKLYTSVISYNPKFAMPILRGYEGNGPPKPETQAEPEISLESLANATA